MSFLLDARPVSTAVIAAVSGAITNPEDPSQAAYDLSTVPGGNREPGTLPDIFAVVQVERRFDESSVRFGSPSGTTAWSVTVTCAGRDVDEAAWVMARTTTALEDVWLTAGDHDLICRFRTQERPVWDDGRFSGYVEFTCAT